MKGFTQPSKEVIHLVVSDVLSGGDTLTLPEPLYTVPSGQRLVITAAGVDTSLNS